MTTVYIICIIYDNWYSLQVEGANNDDNTNNNDNHNTTTTTTTTNDNNNNNDTDSSRNLTSFPHPPILVSDTSPRYCDFDDIDNDNDYRYT